MRDTPVGTARLCELNAEALRAVDTWLDVYKQFWDRSLTRLKAHVEKKK